MTAVVVDRLPVAVLDSHELDDVALQRVARGASQVIAFTTRSSQPTHEQSSDRWARLAPDVAFEDGGLVADVREAIVGCARRRILVLAAPTPSNPARFVAHALQGAAAAVELDVPAVAVHVVRSGARPGPVAWLTQTGLMSGYGVLFAVGFAEIHGLPVVLVEPPIGPEEPRTPEALEQALEHARRARVEVTTVSDPSPLDRVLRDSFSLVVHPVLDAPDGLNLLHRDELPAKSVASGNPAAVVRLIQEFDGDVVAVFDGVRLLYGESHAGRAAAAVLAGVVTVAGLGVVLAPAASASPTGATGNTAVVLVAGSWQSDVTDAVTGLHFVAHPHSGGGTDLEISNTSHQTVTLTITGSHGHGGSVATTQTVVLAPGQSATVNSGGGVKQWDGAVLTGINTIHLDNGIIMMTAGNPILRTPQQLNQVVIEHAPPQTTTHAPIVVTPQPPQVIEEQTPTLRPGVVPSVVSDIPSPMVTPSPTHVAPLHPTVTQQVPTPVVTPPTTPDKVEAPVVVPPLPTTSQVPTPVVTPPTTPDKVEAPILVPPLPTNQQVPTPVVTPPTTPDKLNEPVLVPPLTGTLNEVTVGSISAHLTTGATNPKVTTTETPKVAATVTPKVTTTPDLTDSHQTGEELAHTGAPTGLLAGVAAALLAVGAGLTVAGRRRDDEEPA